MDTPTQASRELEKLRELEELLQEIGDDTHSIRLFNEKLEKEISALKHEESMLLDFILKKRCRAE
jgi:hypothetical protein